MLNTQQTATVTNPSILSQEIRNRLKLDPHIGAGNVIFYANKVNPAPGNKTIHLDQPYIACDGQTYSNLSVNDIHRLVSCYAEKLMACGIRRMDPVGVYLDDGVGYLILYFAITSIGAVPALINSQLPREILLGFLKKIQANYLIVDTKMNSKLEDVNDVTVLNIDKISVSENPSLPSWYPYQHHYDEPIMITHSSGTTGLPKAVTLTHGGFFHGIRHLLGIPMMEGIERLLSSLPSSHNSAIAYSMYALMSGVELMIMSSRQGQDVAKIIQDFRPTTVVSFPKTYVDLALLDENEIDFSSVTYWINSGDAAHEKHIRKLVKHGSHFRGGIKVKGSQFVDGLGSSEMGHTLFRVIHTPYTNNYKRCIGFPQDWVDAVVFDDFGNILAPGNIGRLGVKAASVTPGYWNDSALTAQSKIKGYFLTGDMVKKDEKGVFYHLDRIPDIIKLSEGEIYSVQTEELIISEIDEVFDCTIVGVKKAEKVKSKLIVSLIKKLDKKSKANIVVKISSLLVDNGIPAVDEVKFWDVDTIPVGVTGKVLKRRVRDQLMKEEVK